MNKSSIIKKYTAPSDKELDGRKVIGKIPCAGCGKWIRSDGDLEDVEISVTKRGSCVVFHSDCLNRIWKTKIGEAAS